MKARPGVALVSPGITQTARVHGQSPVCITCTAGKHKSCTKKRNRSWWHHCADQMEKLLRLLSLVFWGFFFIELFNVII